MRASIRQYQQQRLMKASCVETTLSSSCVLAFRQVGRERLLPKSVSGCFDKGRQRPDEDGGLDRLFVHQLRKLSVKLFLDQSDGDQRLPRRGQEQLSLRQPFE